MTEAKPLIDLSFSNRKTFVNEFKITFGFKIDLVLADKNHK